MLPVINITKISRKSLHFFKINVYSFRNHAIVHLKEEETSLFYLFGLETTGRMRLPHNVTMIPACANI
jgi:hypothetical protein